MHVLEMAANRYLLRLRLGEELMASLRDFVGRRKIGAAFVRGLGASRDATLAYYLLDEKRYDPIVVEGFTEVVSLLGNVSWKEDGEPVVHLHAALSRRDGSTLAGHVLKLEVGATMEIDLEVLPGRLVRKMDEEIGLPLLDRLESLSGS
jgi:predicted DNA-binding protein with PD1-like motif